MKKGLIVGIVALVVVGGGVYLEQKSEDNAIKTFEECAKLYPVMESYPEQCRTPEGKLFTRALPETPEIAFGDTFALTVSARARLAGGISIKLLEINDSRCKPGVECVWEGELSPLVAIAQEGKASEEVRLGTVRTKSAVFFDGQYQLELIGATETSAMLVLTPVR